MRRFIKTTPSRVDLDICLDACRIYGTYRGEPDGTCEACGSLILSTRGSRQILFLENPPRGEARARRRLVCDECFQVCESFISDLGKDAHEDFKM